MFPQMIYTMNIVFRFGWLLLLFSSANLFAIPSKFQPFESEVPLLANAEVLRNGEREGLGGSVFNIEERVNPNNVPLDFPRLNWEEKAWRGERVNGQFVIWTSEDISQVEIKCSQFTSADGSMLPPHAVKVSFVRFVGAHDEYTKQDWVEDPGSTFVADIIDPVEKLDLPKNSFRPFWLSVNIPPNAKPGKYNAAIEVSAVGSATLYFDVNVEVLSAQLPEPKDWSFYLDLWQHPWAVSRYHCVQDWSDEHFALMRPLYEELANAGQKVITTTITKSAWNNQTFDDYDTMVKHIKLPDGRWEHDYEVFDRYVSFVMSCGINKAIACYTIVPWGNFIYYTDAKTGKEIKAQAKPGTKDFEDFWGPALKDLVKHLREKGWLDIAYISMDERAPEDMRHATELLKKYAPELKIATAANFAPNELDGVMLHCFVTEIIHVNDKFLKTIPERKKDGMITTYYVCTNDHFGNQFTISKLSESTWTAFYTMNQGMDGFLRWAYNCWPNDPLVESAFGTWPAGDTFFVYPGMRSSLRWEMLRDGIEEFEKIRILRAKLSGSDNPLAKEALANMESVLKEFVYDESKLIEANYTINLVRRMRNSIEAASLFLR